MIETQKDIHEADKDKPRKQSQAQRDLLQACRAKVESYNQHWLTEERREMWRRLDRVLYRNEHYSEDKSKHKLQIGDHWYPKLMVLQMLQEMAVPKITNQNLRPSLRIEGHNVKGLSAAPGDRAVAAAINENKIQAETLEASAQELLNPLLEYYREREGVSEDVDELVHGMVTYGSYAIVDGYAGNPVAFVVSQDDSFCDPYARSREDIKFAGYRCAKTLREIREQYTEWGHLVTASDPDKGDLDKPEDWRDQSHRDAKDYLASRVYVYTIWTQDKTKKKTRKTLRVTSPDEANKYRMDEAWSVKEIYGKNAIGSDIVEAWEVSREIEEDEFPSGWRQVVFTWDVLLDDGKEGKLPKEADLPIKFARYNPVLGSAWAGTGICEMALEPNLLLDACYKYAFEDIGTGHTTLVRENAVQPGNTYRKANESVGRHKTFYIRTRYKGPLREVIETIPATEAAQSALALMEALRMFIEWCTGIYDPRMASETLNDPSGKFAQEMRRGGAERFSRVKRHLASILRSVYHNWILYLVNFEGEKKSYTARTLTREQKVTLAPAIFGNLRFSYDIDVGRGSAIPDDPEEAAAWIEATSDRLVQKPKPLRDLQLAMHELPIEEELRRVMDLVNPPPDPNAPPPDDEVTLEAKKSGLKELAQALSDLVTQDTMPMSIKQVALNSLLQMANGVIPNDLGLLSRGGFEPPPADPMLPPAPQGGPGAEFVVQ